MSIVSNASVPSSKNLPHAAATETSLKRDEWMLDTQITPTALDGPSESAEGTESERVDFFSGIGREARKRPPTRIVEQASLRPALQAA